MSVLLQGTSAILRGPGYVVAVGICHDVTAVPCRFTAPYYGRFDIVLFN